MKNAVVFSGRNGLDFYDLRTNVVRIPEVSGRLREAQQILDLLNSAGSGPSVDLINVMLSDDEHFFRNIKLKSLIAAIVQVGLFDRYLKSQPLPLLMVGISNGESAARVAAGLQSFREMIEAWYQSQTSDVIKLADRVAGRVAEPAPLLSGISLSEFSALRAEVQEDGLTIYRPTREGSMDLKKLVAALISDDGVTRFVSIGPAPALRPIDYQSLIQKHEQTLGVSKVDVVDSIDLDEQLSWFWREVRLPSPAFAVAQ
jgi:hypothetical protein